LLISVSGAHFPTFGVIFLTFKNSKPVSYYVARKSRSAIKRKQSLLESMASNNDLSSDSSDDEDDDNDNGGVETSLPADPAVEVATVAPRSKQQQKADAKVVRQLKAKHILEAGLVISERKEATMQVLEREVLAEFKRRVDKDPNASSSQKANMLLAQQQKEITGARVWKRFTEIKKIITLTFLPLLKDPINHSGWDWIA
jgi:hypothetical protein